MTELPAVRWCRRLLGTLCCVVLSQVAVAAASPSAPAWPSWDRFAKLYVTDDGRVIDRSVPEQITTSEGQSYALFFALVANDRDAFARVLKWTADNLAQGDLSARLPAWQWGRAGDGAWRVMDSNPASDSDLWIAYALAEAGRLWCMPEYTQLSRSMAARILREEVAFIPGLGPTLLPGPQGFVERDTWRLNASYVPIQVLRALSKQSHQRTWTDLIRTSERLIEASAPKGFAADWIQYRAGTGFVVDRETRGAGSYNAIRVYLWAGTLAPKDPLYAKLQKRLRPMVASAAARDTVVEIVDTQTLAMQGNGSPGFSAALLPMLANADRSAALAKHKAYVLEKALVDGHSYYSDVLSLFGLGWLNGQYRFERSGELAVRWSAACRTAR